MDILKIMAALVDIVKGWLQWKQEHDLLEAGRALQSQEEGKTNEELADKTAALQQGLTDADVDKLLKPPSER